MNIEVLFFGGLAELMGCHQFAMNNCTDTQELLDKLFLKNPNLKSKTFRLALNSKLINKKEILKNGDQLALLPPFVGG